LRLIAIPAILHVPQGTVFTAFQLSQRTARLITSEKYSVTVAPGESQTINLAVLSLDMLLKPPELKADLMLNKLSLPDEIKQLLQNSSFNAASYRTRQYAIWVITYYPQSIMNVKIGQEGDFQSPTKDELRGIKTIFQDAGISLDKYPAIQKTE
jgi:hypothetical protein